MTEQTHYPDWQELTPLPYEPRPYVVEGSKFVVVETYIGFDRGTIVELVRNDKTNAPYFKQIGGKFVFSILWSNLAPLPQQRKTTQPQTQIDTTLKS